MKIAQAKALGVIWVDSNPPKNMVLNDDSNGTERHADGPESAGDDITYTLVEMQIELKKQTDLLESLTDYEEPDTVREIQTLDGLVHRVDVPQDDDDLVL